MSKPCIRCGSLEIAPMRIKRGDYRCKPCIAKDAKAYAARHEMSPASKALKAQYAAIWFRRSYADPASRQRHIARSATRAAVRYGRLIRQPCEVCGHGVVEAHHDDYSQPLNVRWLCPTHHRAHHAAERALSRAA